MRTLQWYQQDETTDEDGFYLQPPAVYEAERKALADAGCPSPDLIVFRSHEPEDRDTAILTASVHQAAEVWMRNEDWGCINDFNA